MKKAMMLAIVLAVVSIILALAGGVQAQGTITADSVYWGDTYPGQSVKVNNLEMTVMESETVTITTGTVAKDPKRRIIAGADSRLYVVDDTGVHQWVQEVTHHDGSIDWPRNGEMPIYGDSKVIQIPKLKWRIDGTDFRRVQVFDPDVRQWVIDGVVELTGDMGGFGLMQINGLPSLVWNASDPNGNIIQGYTVLWGTATGMYTKSMDVGPDILAVPLAVLNLVTDVKYYFTVFARGNLGNSGKAIEISAIAGGVGVGPDPRCSFPLGDRSVFITVTRLQLTGSGGAGSKARLDFQVASGGTPINKVSVMVNGQVVAVAEGIDVGALAGMWFTVPAGMGGALSVQASNTYGCSKTQSTTYTVGSGQLSIQDFR